MKGPRYQLVLAIVTVVSVMSGLVTARAQQPTIGELRLSMFVDTASARAADYFAFFRDLTAEETKTVEQMRENGEVSRRRTIVSDLIVYRSLIDNGSISEYRDVKSVDGTPIAGREQRVQALFARQSRAKSVRDELRKVNTEGSRYDLDYTISGLTMSQGLPLQPWARALFTFQEAGTESVDGREAVILSYQQVAPNSRFGFNLSLPADLRAAEPLFRGWVWLEPGTARLVREVREVTVLPSGSSTPVVVQRFEFQYGPSRFGILLPTRIVFSSLGHFSRSERGITSSVKYRLRFDYGEFRRFTASSDDEQLAGAEAGGGQPDPGAASADLVPGGEPSIPYADADLGPEFGPDAPMGPPQPMPTSAPSRAEESRSTVAPVATGPAGGHISRPARPASSLNSSRLTIVAGLPASVALSIPPAPIPLAGPSAGGAPTVAIPPPPLAPGERPKLRPPP